MRDVAEQKKIACLSWGINCVRDKVSTEIAWERTHGYYATPGQVSIIGNVMGIGSKNDVYYFYEQK